MAHCIMGVVHDILYTSINQKIVTVIFFHSILNALKIPTIYFDVNVVIDIANDILSV